MAAAYPPAAGYPQQRPVSPQPQQRLQAAPAQQRSPSPGQQRPVSPQPQKIVVTFPSKPENFEEPTRLNGEMALDYLQYRPVTPLPSPPAGPEVIKPNTISFTEWAVAQKDVFLKLDEEAKGLAGSYQKLVDEVDIIGQLNRAKAHAPKAINKAAWDLQEAERKLDKTKHSMKKMFHPDNYRKKMDLREKAVEDAKKALEKAKGNQADVANQLQQALQEKVRLEGSLQREKQIRAHQQAILNAMVEGKARDADEAAAELAVQMFMQVCGQIDLAFADQREALQLITQSVETLDRVLKLFPEHSAASVKPNESGAATKPAGAATAHADGVPAPAPSAHGDPADEPKDNQSPAGAALQNQLVIVAQNLIKSAHQYSPYMPSAYKGTLDAFISMVFDAAADSNPETAKKQLDDIGAAFTAANYSMRWQKQFVKNIARDRELSSTNLHASRDKLLFERTRLSKALNHG
eukprot:CAMPEP_0196653186 /NCGR_PEP_ID=MMETSP1086-20130531/2789_1 /TAXON_ID=77921 /ORGANISM="Cyanoptyche  gloeocystis , Strain SAG4.97" /LENGTH=463 /DNA_ID=CAMNT_0041984251 /DNA_START=19 /DNA_END=1410 /DNA_ORIENTATION=+